MNILNNGRFGLGAGAGSQVKRVMAIAAEHVSSRKQFGRSLSEFGLIKEKFAKIAINAYAIESMAYMTTGMIDRGDPSCEIEAAMCKVFGSEIAFDGINECIQVMGGTGFMKDWPFERQMRDCRILSIFEGTNEILRMLIALTGLKAAGDRLQTLGKALKNPLADPSGLVSEVVDRLGRKYAPKELKGVENQVKDAANLLQSRTNEFGAAVEWLLQKHEKSVMNEQIQLKRIADSAIDLFAMTSVISRTSNSITSKNDSAHHEIRLTNLFCDLASDRIRKNLAEIRSNDPQDKAVIAIADEVFAQARYIPSHPTGVN